MSWRNSLGGVEGVRKGCVAAFASTFGGADTERRVLLVADTPRRIR